MRSRMREKAMLKTAVLWKEKKSCDNFRALLLLLLLLVVRLRLQMVVFFIIDLCIWHLHFEQIHGIYHRRSSIICAIFGIDR